MTTLELRPNRKLLNPNFAGYKTQIKEMPNQKRYFQSPVQHLTVAPHQHSFFYSKLFSTHNHLHADKYDNFHGLYFFNEELRLIKLCIDETTDSISNPIEIFTLPKKGEHINTDTHYYASIYFAGPQYAVVSDGVGYFYIVNTGNKRNNERFHILFDGRVLEHEYQGFLVADAFYNEQSKQLHAVLLHIEEDPVDRFVFIINWLTFAVNDRGNWSQTALRRLKTKGDIDYLHLEKNCKYIYVIHEKEVKFITNSEYPIKESSPESTKVILYKWSQNEEKVCIKYPLKEPVQKDQIEVSTESKYIEINYCNEILLVGELAGKIDARQTTWEVSNKSVLECDLRKVDGSGLWSEFVVGDQNGQLVLDSSVVEQMQEVIKSFSSGTEEEMHTMPTFNTQQMEECDYENNKSIIFERISGQTNEVTHKVDLGAHQVVISPSLESADRPTFGIRQGDDICIWQPINEDENFDCKHEATLQALGYIQASKEAKKFTICSPNADYTVICGSTGHVFVYCQRETLASSELKNRKTGEILSNTAILKVFFTPQEILGLFPGNKWLHILTKEYLLALYITENKRPSKNFS